MPISRSNFRFGFIQTKIKLAVVALFLIFSLPLSIEHAVAQRSLSIETARDYNFGIWANAGNLSSTQTLCAVAWDAKNAGRNYSVLLRNLIAGGGYYLYLDGDVNATGTSRIQISFAHADAFSGNTYETLIEGSWETQKQKGQAPGCPNGGNSHLRVNIESTELASKRGGDYIGYFRQSIKEGSLQVDAISTFAVSLTIGGVPNVQISHLDSIDFGAYSGFGDLSADESFCVYSASYNGAYRLSVSSTGQDVNGHFIEEVSGLGRIPLTILYAASGAGPGSEVITNNYVYGQGDSASTDCSGKENTTLTLQLSESDLQSAPTGTYSGQLTILVEPE